MRNSIEINPGQLKALRKKRHLGQQELAEKIGVDAATVSRWERGAISGIRARTFRKLISALDVGEGELCNDNEVPEIQPARQETRREQVNLVIDTACRNAMALVAKRYGVSRQQIVEAAPMLFYIAAEECLRKREKNIDEIEARCQSAEEAAPPHLPIESPWRAEVDEALDAERQSIVERDLFGVRVAKEVGFAQGDEAKINPFARFLSERLNGVSDPKRSWGVHWDLGAEPRYCIGSDEALALVGGDKNAAALILKGVIALHEMPGAIRRATAEEKARWVNDKFKKLRNSKSEVSLPDINSFVEELDVQIMENEEAIRLRNDPTGLEDDI